MSTIKAYKPIRYTACTAGPPLGRREAAVATASRLVARVPDSVAWLNCRRLTTREMGTGGAIALQWTMCCMPWSPLLPTPLGRSR